MCSVFIRVTVSRCPRIPKKRGGFYSDSKQKSSGFHGISRKKSGRLKGWDSADSGIPGFRDSGIPGFQRKKNPVIPRDSWDSTKKKSRIRLIPRIPRLQKSPGLQKLDCTGLLPKTINFSNIKQYNRFSHYLGFCPSLFKCLSLGPEGREHDRI